MLDAVADRCERLVNASVVVPSDRHVQRRLIGLALASPFLICPALAILLSPMVGVSGALVAVVAVFGMVFLAAASVSFTGRPVIGSAGMFIAGVPSLAAIILASGGLNSPTALVILAPTIEACWAGRSSKALTFGIVASVVTLSLVALLGMQPAFDTIVPSAANWLLPLAYVAVLVPRVPAWSGGRADVPGSRRPLEDIIDAVVMRTDLAGDITDVSSQAHDILGLAPELLLSNGLFDRLHVADRVIYLCALSDLKQEAGVRRIEVRARAPGATGSSAGDYRPFILEMTRAATEDKAITLLLRTGDSGIPSNIHQPVPGESTEKADLAAKRMLAAVSHELRTPLNSIIGFSDLLLHDMAGSFSDARQKKYISLVNEAGNHLLSVVNSMLDISRLDAGGYSVDPESFRLEEPVETCRSMLSRQLEEKKLEFQVDISPSIGLVRADKRAIKQILINLMSNAIKFTPKGGKVAIGAKRLGASLHFWVADTGVGISEEDLARIGEPFCQVRNDYTRNAEGAGLGLSLVKGLVALHKGTMSIESEFGHGTTVNICLTEDASIFEVAADLAEIPPSMTKRPEEACDGPFRKSA
ncbi:MAG: PAS domain-containing sensor histidine kinase [Rhizobiaceae bacterium]|nr:PAS domain-containing sensor histidine kinase [Rhizobiaceae bacterium]